MTADPAPTIVAPPFAWPLQDRLAHRRTDALWLDRAWQSAKVLLVSRRSTTPVVRDGATVSLRLVDSVGLAGLGIEVADDDRTFLGSYEGQMYFAVAAEPDYDDVANWAGLRDIGADVDALGAGLATTAVALAQWHAKHTHCPRCGAPTVPAKAGWIRVCTAEGSEHFPRCDPAVIMLVHDGGDRCVLGRQTVWPAGRYSVLAGFVEPGESAEAAVVREVQEEVGLLCTDVRYVASQPWPFPASLMLGFSARVTGGQDIQVDAHEIENARWFTRDDVRAAIARSEHSGVDFLSPQGADEDLAMLPGGISIARLLLDGWLAQE